MRERRNDAQEIVSRYIFAVWRWATTRTSASTPSRDLCGRAYVVIFFHRSSPRPHSPFTSTITFPISPTGPGKMKMGSKWSRLCARWIVQKTEALAHLLDVRHRGSARRIAIALEEEEEREGGGVGTSFLKWSCLQYGRPHSLVSADVSHRLLRLIETPFLDSS